MPFYLQYGLYSSPIVKFTTELAEETVVTTKKQEVLKVAISTLQ